MKDAKLLSATIEETITELATIATSINAYLEGIDETQEIKRNAFVKFLQAIAAIQSKLKEMSQLPEYNTSLLKLNENLQEQIKYIKHLKESYCPQFLTLQPFANRIQQTLEVMQTKLIQTPQAPIRIGVEIGKQNTFQSPIFRLFGSEEAIHQMAKDAPRESPFMVFFNNKRFSYSMHEAGPGQGIDPSIGFETPSGSSSSSSSRSPKSPKSPSPSHLVLGSQYMQEAVRFFSTRTPDGISLNDKVARYLANQMHQQNIFTPIVQAVETFQFNFDEVIGWIKSRVIPKIESREFKSLIVEQNPLLFLKAKSNIIRLNAQTNSQVACYQTIFFSFVLADEMGKKYELSEQDFHFILEVTSTLAIDEEDRDFAVEKHYFELTKTAFKYKSLNYNLFLKLKEYVSVNILNCYKQNEKEEENSKRPKRG